MQYRRLGHGPLEVSELSFGTWLTVAGGIGREQAIRCIHAAVDHGITLFDTANQYGAGEAERVLGEGLRAYPRDRYMVATKLYFPVGDEPDRGLSAAQIEKQLNRSLERLGVEYIDLYQCHRYDENTPLEETCDAMNDLVRSGKIVYWGVSEWNADQITAACTLARENGWAIPISNQPQYSALWRNVQRDVFPACREFGLGNVVWSPLAQGILTGKYTSARTVPAGTRAASNAAGMMTDYFTQPVLDAVQRLKPLAERAGCTLAQLALAWCLRDDIVSAVIVGATRPEQVDDNVAAADLVIDPAIFQQMDQILVPVAPG